MLDRSTLLKKIKEEHPYISEVLCRKYLSKVGDDIEIWRILFDILVASKNYPELKLLVKDLLKKTFFSTSYLLLCIRYLLLSNNYALARKLFAKINFSTLPKINQLKNDFHHLALIEKIKSNKNLLPLSYEVMPIDAHKFNQRAVNLLNNLPVEVVCYIGKDFHYSIQYRIAEVLLSQNVKVIFSNCIWFINTIKPRVILISEALYQNLPIIRSINPNVLIVNTRHGLGDKNHAGIGASHCDKICVSSEGIKKLLIDEMLIPDSKIWVTGYSQLDDYLQSFSTENDSCVKPSIQTILFAPTFNKGLSSASFLKTDLVKKLRGAEKNIKIIVKPHPHLLKNSSLIDTWIDESRHSSNVVIDTDPTSNITKYFHESDLMVSDVSSVALAWLLEDKPLVCLIDRKAAEVSGHYSPDGIEWKIHDAATVVDNSLDLCSTIKKQLGNPKAKSKQREVFSSFLFGNLKDGKSSLRVAENIVRYLRGNIND